MFCVPTPYSIQLNDSVDVFSEIIPETDDYYTAKRSALWAVYGDIGLGNTNTEYWIRRMKGRYYEIKNEYDLKIKAFETMKAKIAASGISTDDNEQSTTVENHGKTTVKDSYSDGALTVENNLLSSNYDPPQIPTSTSDAKSYLNDMTADTGTVTTKDTRTHTTETEVSAGADGVKAGTITTVKGGSGLETETIKKWMESVEDPYRAFAKEFAKYFYWGL